MSVDTIRLKKAAGIEPYERRLSSLRRSGAAYKAKCPWHDDKNPSLGVFQKDGEWFFKCHPCDKGGDLIRFVELYDEVEFREAVETIAKECGVQNEPIARRFEYNREEAVEALKNCDAVAEYLKSRGIERLFAVINGIGVVDYPGIGTAISIPYNDSVVKFRALNPTEKGGKFRHLIGHDSHELLYGIESIDASNENFVKNPEVFVIESELDSLTMRAHGFNAVSVSSATTCLKDGKLRIKDDHLAKLMLAERVFIVTDMDAAGEKCAAAFEAVLPRHKAYRISWPYQRDAPGPKDIGEVYLQAPHKFTERVRQLREEALNRPPAWRALFKTHDQMEQGDMRFLIKDFLPEGVCLLGALSSSGKTWFALSMAKALTTGRNFLGLGRFEVAEPVNVIYLVPEAGERSFRGRMDKMGIRDRFYCRTMKDGLPPKLDDPLLLAAVRDLKPAIFLDTAVRFVTVESENSASENANGLAAGIFNLLNAGAQAIVGLHHSPKNSREQEMTLENVLRGTGDIGAMCDAVYGLRVVDKEKLEVKVKCVKDRDFEGALPFHIQGRPYINDKGDFGVLFEPSAVTKELTEGEKLAAAITANPTVSYRELEQITGIALKRIGKIAEKIGWSKVGGAWTRPENQQELIN
jgi:5S rRNA maturation endonuclease (ribonuclease M5)